MIQGLEIENDVRYVLEQHTKLDFNSASLLKQQSVGRNVAPLRHCIDSASSLKQQSAGRHVAPLRHIILIPCQSDVAFIPNCCCVFNGEATKATFVVFGLTRPGHYLLHSRRATHYTTDTIHL
jgi:hypothetical protein